MALTGPELLAKVKELGEVTKSELVRACGYVSTKKDGTERLNFTAFYEQLLEAKGVGFANGKSASKNGRRLSYLTKVQFNGNLLIGKAYTALLDLQPGDEFEIKLGRKQIRLIPAGSEDLEEGGQSPLVAPAVCPATPAAATGEQDPDDEGDGEEE